MTETLDFFVIGVQKGGTTALDKMLREHPDIQLPDTRKELHFFDDETLDWPSPDFGQLHRHFQSPRAGRTRGEVTPIYIFWPNALDRIQRYNPDAKLILLLREPGHRAFSHWRMETTRNRENLEFSDAISEVGRRRIGPNRAGLRNFTYIERSCYAGQIERLLNLFPREQVLFLRTDALWTDTPAAIRQVGDFLGVDVDRFGADTSRSRYIVPVQGSLALQLDDPTRQRLKKAFATDVIRTADLTGLNLSDWLDEGYSEPMISNKTL